MDRNTEKAARICDKNLVHVLGQILFFLGSTGGERIPHLIFIDSYRVRLVGRAPAL